MLGWFKKKTKIVEETNVEFMNRTGSLPCCGSSEAYEGPSGGVSTNIECAGCGQRWNVARWGGRVFHAEKI